MRPLGIYEGEPEAFAELMRKMLLLSEVAGRAAVGHHAARDQGCVNSG